MKKKDTFHDIFCSIYFNSNLIFIQPINIPKTQSSFQANWIGWEKREHKTSPCVLMLTIKFAQPQPRKYICCQTKENLILNSFRSHNLNQNEWFYSGRKVTKPYQSTLCLWFCSQTQQRRKRARILLCPRKLARGEKINYLSNVWLFVSQVATCLWTCTWKILSEIFVEFLSL